MVDSARNVRWEQSRISNIKEIHLFFILVMNELPPLLLLLPPYQSLLTTKALYQLSNMGKWICLGLILLLGQDSMHTSFGLRRYK